MDSHEQLLATIHEARLVMAELRGMLKDIKQEKKEIHELLHDTPAKLVDYTLNIAWETKLEEFQQVMEEGVRKASTAYVEKLGALLSSLNQREKAVSKSIEDFVSLGEEIRKVYRRHLVVDHRYDLEDES